MDSTALVAAVVVLLVAFVIQKMRNNRKRPPGPWGLLFVGYVPFLKDRPYLDFQRLAEKYGSIFSVQMGRRYMIVLNDFKSTKDAFEMDEFFGRPPVTPFETDPRTLASGATTGMRWVKLRKFSMHMLKGLGFGKSRMEKDIQEEIYELFERLEGVVGTPVPIRKYLGPSMSNNIGSMLFGKRLQYNDPIRVMFDTWITETSGSARQVSRLLFIPGLRRLYNWYHYGDGSYTTSVSGQFKAYVRKEIEEHEKTLDPENPRDYIDGFLAEMRKNIGSPAYQKYVLQDLTSGFLNAGTETVRTTMEWLLLTVAAHQDVQRRIQKEIDETIGRNVFPVYKDHKSLPYTTAVVNEVMRWRPIIPINILRYTLSDAELHGYNIPKHAYVVSNIWAIHHDVKFWGNDVDQFKPERFLTKDGKIKKMEQFIPFSIGKRSCPGKRMARVEIFLYLISILQKFSISLPEGHIADFEGVLGVGLQIKPQEIVFTKRS